MPTRAARPLLLLAFADDRSDPRAQLSGLREECRRVRAVLDRGHTDGSWELEVREHVTLDEMLHLVQEPTRRDRLAVFHFAGHAGPTAILLEDAAGGPAAAHGGGLAALLGGLPALRLVVLNGCDTRGQADALAAVGGRAVITTDAAIDDAVATDFAADFYTALVGGATLQEAVGRAEGATRMRRGDDPRAAYGPVRDLVARGRDAPPPWPWALHPVGDAVVAGWRLRHVLRGPLVGLPALPPSRLPREPYRRLLPFTRDEAALFFGREEDVANVHARLTDRGAAPVLLLFGAAGAGKSSLLEAGVLPRLHASHEVRSSGREPRHGLAGTLRRVLGVPEDVDVPALAEAWRALEHPNRPLVVVIDQAEEAFTRPRGDPYAELAEFAADVAALVTADVAAATRAMSPRPGAHPPPRKLVVSFRKEWLAELRAAFEAHGVWHASHFVQRLDRDGIVAAIRGPADDPGLRRQYHLEVEPALAERIAQDLLDDPDAPLAPTLQVLLAKMWDAAPVADGGRRTFDAALYQRLRREGILLGDFVDQQLGAFAARQPGPEASGLVLDLLHAHTTPSGTAQALTRGGLAARYPQTGAALEALLEHCRALHLLVEVQPDPAAGAATDARRTRLAHDTLAPYVRERFAASQRPGQRARRLVEQRAADRGVRPDSRAFDDADLAVLDTGLAGMRAPTPDEQRLVDASRLEARRRRGEDVLRQVADARDPLERARRLVRLVGEPEPDGGLEAVAEVLAHLDACPPPVRHLPIGRPATVRVGPVFSPDGRRIVAGGADFTALVWRLGTAAGDDEPAVLRGHTNFVASVAFSPNGERVVTASSDGTARIWAADGSGDPIVLRGHEAGLSRAAFSPDGTRVVTAGADHTVRVWRADGTGTPIVLRQDEYDVSSAAFSPDAARIVTTSGERTVRLWRSDGSGEPVVFVAGAAPRDAVFSPDGTRLLVVTDHGVHVLPADGSGPSLALGPFENYVRGAAFSPDGTRLVAADASGGVRVWRTDGVAAPVVLDGPRCSVNAVAVSPDGARIAAGAEDGRVWLFAIDGTAEPVVFRGHHGAVAHVAFRPDGRVLATAGPYGPVRLWPGDLSRAPRLFLEHERSIVAAAVAPDGARLVTVAQEGTIRAWPLDARPERSRSAAEAPVVLAALDRRVWSAAVSPDGRHVVTAGGYVRVWRTDRPAEPIVLGCHDRDEVVLAAAWSPDGTRVITGAQDGTARIWHADGSGVPVVLRGSAGSVVRVAFSPDGRRVLTADAQTRLWNADGSGEPVVLPEPDGAQRSAAFSPDGTRVVTAGRDGAVRIWRADGSGEPLVMRGHADAVTDAAFDADGARVVTASEDRTARLWRADGRGRPLVLRGHTDVVRSAAFSPDGRRVLTVAADRTARVWPAGGAGPPLVFDAVDATIEHAAFTDDGSRVVVTLEDGLVRLWSVGAGDGNDTAFRTLRTPAATRATAVASSPDGARLVVACEDATAQVWPAAGDGGPLLLRGHADRVRSAAFSPDGKWIVTAAEDETVRVWPADGTGPSHVLDGHTGGVMSAVFSPDGSRILSASRDATARLHAVDGGRPHDATLAVLRGHDGAVVRAAFAPDGGRIVTASADGTARIWPVDASGGSGATVVLRGHTGPLTDAAFSPDGAHVVTASHDRTARVWATAGSEEPAVLRGHTGPVTGAAFSPDGRHVVTTSTDGTLRVWRPDGLGEPVVLRVLVEGRRAAGEESRSVGFGRAGTPAVYVAAGGEVFAWPLAWDAMLACLERVRADREREADRGWCPCGCELRFVLGRG